MWFFVPLGCFVPETDNLLDLLRLDGERDEVPADAVHDILQ